MQERNLQDFITSYRDIRHTLFSWFDTESVDRLSAVNGHFKLFCDEKMIWAERLLRVFNIHAAASDDPKKIYLRLKGEYAELGAYLKQFCILKLLLGNETHANTYLDFNDSVIIDTWKPLSDDELLKLTIKYGGSKDDFEHISDMINIITSEKDLFLNPKLNLSKQQNKAAVAAALGDSMSLSFATQEGSIKDLLNINHIPNESKQAYTDTCNVGLAFILAPIFLSRRGYTEALKTFLDRINKNNFPDIKSIAQNPREVSIDYGEEILKKALGHLCLLTTGMVLQEPCMPSTELVEYFIARNANCVIARDEASGLIGLTNGGMDGYTALYYNPLAMVAESIGAVNIVICKDRERAIATLRELEKIAIMLLDNGEDLNRVFMPNIKPEKSSTPAKILRATLKSNRPDSEIDNERIRIIKNILAYQPAPKPNNDEYVDNFPYANRA